MASLLDESVPTQQNERASPQCVGAVTERCATILGGHHTDLVLTRYADRTLVVVTQIRKLGTVLEIRRDAANCPGTSGGRHVYATSVLLGKDQEEIHLFGRMLAESLNIDKPLLVFLGVKHLDVPMSKLIVNYVTSKLAC